MLQRICVFCGSNSGNRPDYRHAVLSLARAAVERRVAIAYGGASRGLMGVLADEVLALGGRVYGVLPRRLDLVEIAHPSLTELYRVESMHQRKAVMTELADAFVALPGGYGTLDELFEALAWSQLGIHRKPVGLLNVAGFFDQLLSYLDHAVGEGFLSPHHRDLVMTSNHPDDLLDQLSVGIPRMEPEAGEIPLP
ncbi:MAG: TIGR00730 family Rossman fold protein [Acidobacteriota bacterium]